jgi:hypothetical protein
MIRNFQGQRDSSLLPKLFFLSVIIITANFLIGIFAPTVSNLDDEITFLDSLWRVVVGQRVGIDYHNPYGFGPYQLGALLWHWLGPHYYIMQLAITLFNLSIACCGCIVAERTLARRMDLALLFCAALAFQLSAPTNYNAGPTGLGLSGFHDRQIVSALAVLFLQTFGGGSRFSTRGNAFEIALAAFLLNVLFLIKISGPMVGLLILLAGCLLQGPAVHRLLNLCVTLLAFAVITAIEFKITGLEFLPVIQDYELAAQARLAYSFYDLVRGVMSWPLLSSVALLLLFVVLQHLKERRPDFWSLGLIIGSYGACQFALNMTNSGDPNMWLAPAAVISLAACMSVKALPPQANSSECWWWKSTSSRLADISLRESIPFLIVIVVLVPEVLGSIVATAGSVFVSLGIKVPYVVTAGKGVSFKSFMYKHEGPGAYAYERSLNDAVTAISSLNLGDKTIANLDFANPFPVLFLAPPPKGIQVWWNFGFNVPRGAMLKWQDVIGDACVVTIPAEPSLPATTIRLADIVRQKLATDFKLVYQDSLWSIYRRASGCTSAPLL